MVDLKNLFIITKHPSTTQIFLTSLFFLSLFLLSSSSLSDFSPSLIVSSFTSRLLTAANFFTSPSYSSTTSDPKTLLSSVSPRRIRVKKIDSATKDLTSCDIFDGNWVFDDSEPVYLPGYCPFVEDKFNCYKNGRPDLGFLNHRWQPHGCSIPRFDGEKMLKMLKGKRLVFVGDSLNRNMWESLVCSLRSTLENKNRDFKVSGKQSNLHNEGFYSYKKLVLFLFPLFSKTQQQFR